MRSLFYLHLPLALAFAVLFQSACSSNIWEACCNGDVKTVKKLQIANSTKEFLLQRNYEGDTPLHIACSCGQLNVVKALLDIQKWWRKSKTASNIDYRKQLYATNDVGFSPLMNALETTEFDPKIARLLIRKDPSREHLTIMGDGINALGLAATRGQITVLERLMKHLKPQDLFEEYTFGMTALFLAATADRDTRFTYEKGVGHVATRRDATAYICTKILLDNDPTNTLVLERSFNGKTALDFARKTESSAIELLQREQNRQLMERFTAIIRGDVKQVKHLMATSGFNVENFLLQSDQDGETPMLCAVENNRLDVVKVLLNVDGWNNKFTEGRSVDYRKQLLQEDSEGETPLLRALASTDTRAIASLLLDTDTSREHLTSKSKDGSTPLIIAAYLGDLEMMERILQHLEVSDILDVDDSHRSVLMFAARTDAKSADVALKAIRLLLAKDTSNFSALQKDDEKMMAFHIAENDDNLPEALEELENSQKKAMEALDQVISACRNGDVEAVKAFMRQAGAAAGQILCLDNGDGATPMIEAVSNNQLDVVKVLLNVDGWHTEFCNGRSADYRAQLMKSGKEGNHPLAKALLRNSNPEIALLLLAVDTSRKHLSLKNYWGRSPLMLAAEHLHLEALRRIFENLNAADLFEVDNIQESPLMFAAKNKDDDTSAVVAVEFLLAKDSTKLSILMRNQQNQSALDLASKNGRIYGLLKSKYEDARRIQDEVMQACAAGSKESVKKFMIEARTLTGALLTIPAEDGDTPLIRAIRNNQRTVIGILLNENNWHSFAIARGRVDYNKQLRVRGSNGSPPLIWALESSKVEPSIATLLIHLDKSTEHMLVKDTKGRNAAMVAASQGRVLQLREILSHLEQRDLLLQSKDEGKNVLMYALEEPKKDSNSTKDAFTTVDTILKKSRNMRLQHSKSSILGMTALEYAKKQARTRQDVISLLEDDRNEKFLMSPRTQLKVSRSLVKMRRVEQSIRQLGDIDESKRKSF